MAGGDSYPNPIRWSELQAWAHFHNPTHWEIIALKSMDAAWLAAKNGHRNIAESRHQGRGEYCGGSKIDICQANLGAALDAACATCPN